MYGKYTALRSTRGDAKEETEKRTGVRIQMSMSLMETLGKR